MKNMPFFSRSAQKQPAKCIGKRVLALLLVLVTVVGMIPTMSAPAKAAAISSDAYALSPESIKLNGKTYQKATTEKVVNGVPALTWFFLQNGSIVTDEATLEKLLFIETVRLYYMTCGVDTAISQAEIAVQAVNGLGKVLISKTLGSAIWTFAKFVVNVFTGKLSFSDFLDLALNDEMKVYLSVLLSVNSYQRKAIASNDTFKSLMKQYTQKNLTYDWADNTYAAIRESLANLEALQAVGETVNANYKDNSSYNGVTIWSVLEDSAKAVYDDVKKKGVAALVGADAAEEIIDAFDEVNSMESMLDFVGEQLGAAARYASIKNADLLSEHRNEIGIPNLSNLVYNSQKLAGSSTPAETIPPASGMNEATFAARIAELQKTFVDGQYWNKYSASDYSRTGTVKCRCSGTYCKGTCSCACGQFYYKGKWYGGQCHGYALKLGYLIFGSVATVKWKKHKNAYNVWAGDLVRISNNSHTFFVYKVDGDTIYYTECNNSKPCQVKWGRTITKAQLAKKVTYILHNPAYNLTGCGTAPADPIVNQIHTSEDATVRSGYFTLKNKASGYFMNVYGGKDADGTAVGMWQYDNSTDQHFNVQHAGNGKYRFYAACSENGTWRVVDVNRGTAAPTSGQKVDIRVPRDETAQLFYIVPMDDGSYVLELASKNGYVIAPASASAAATNGAQLTLQLYTGADYQKWKICNNNGKETYAVGNYCTGVYTVDTDGDRLHMRNGPGAQYDHVTYVPDGASLNITQVHATKINWGYGTYNGYSGWICLDYAVFAPSVTSIALYSAPYLEKCFVGETLEPDGLEIVATYSNGTTQNIPYSNAFELTTVNENAQAAAANDFILLSTYAESSSAPSFATSGTQTVMVTYNGQTTSFAVEVEEVHADSIEFETAAAKTEYSIGEALDTTGLTLRVKYNDGYEEVVSSGYTTAYDFSTAGTKAVTVTYKNCSATYTVTVLPAPTVSVDGVVFNQEMTALMNYPAEKTASVYIIPAGVTTIESSSFMDCSNLTAVTIPNGTATVGSLAFSGCSGLTSLAIGDSVTEISYGAFSECDSLTNIYYEGTEEQWNAIVIGSNNDILLDAQIYFNCVTSDICSTEDAEVMWAITDANEDGIGDTLAVSVSQNATEAVTAHMAVYSDQGQMLGLKTATLTQGNTETLQMDLPASKQAAYFKLILLDNAFTPVTATLNDTLSGV